MLDRPRHVPLLCAIALLAALALLSWGVHDAWGWLVEIDGGAEDMAGWAAARPWTDLPLELVERGFGGIGSAIGAGALALLMFAKGHRRAGLLVVGVALWTWLATHALKRVNAIDRPEWQDQVRFHETYSFPSGHASYAAALAGLVVVVVSMLIRRAAIRRLLGTLACLLGVVICLDRILLGRHFPSDVVGGALLGAAVVLLGIAVYNPLPRSHALHAAPLPQAYPPSGDLAVILNPIKVESVEQFQTIVRQQAAAAGWNEPRWYFTTVEDPGTGQAERAALDGAELVIVCGGDGTVREVCAELAGTGVPVGIVPAGTGNLLARNLDIPLFIRAAVDIALTGQDRAIDMVEVHGDDLEKTHFMVMAGMGFDAAIMEGVNEDIKKRVGWLAYVLSALKSLMFPAAKVEVSIDGGPWTKHRARTVLIGNVGYLQAGMPLLPDAAIDDGQLDVVLLNPQSFFSWIPLAVRVLTRHRATDELIDRRTGRQVSIRAAAPTPRQLDGDTVGLGQELHAECIHGRVLVRVPR